jgi:hypothetical protein
MVVILYIILIIAAMVALLYIAGLLVSVFLAVFMAASNEIAAYWYALIPFCIGLIIITPWYIWVPGIWFTLSYLKYKENSSVKNPLIK